MAGRHPAGQYGGALFREQVRCLPIRSLACTIPCAASSQSAVLGCSNSHHKPAVSKLFSRQWCAPAERCAYAKFPLSFVNAYTGNRKCRWVLHSDFFSAGCARFSSISSTPCRRASEVQTWPRQRTLYFERLQESSVDASRQPQHVLTPNNTTIPSFAG